MLTSSLVKPRSFWLRVDAVMRVRGRKCDVAIFFAHDWNLVAAAAAITDRFEWARVQTALWRTDEHRACIPGSPA